MTVHVPSVLFILPACFAYFRVFFFHCVWTGRVWLASRGLRTQSLRVVLGNVRSSFSLPPALPSLLCVSATQGSEHFCVHFFCPARADTHTHTHSDHDVSTIKRRGRAPIDLCLCLGRRGVNGKIRKQKACVYKNAEAGKCELVLLYMYPCVGYY